MDSKDFTSVLSVDRSAEEVYKAINNVRAWWQGEISGNTLKAGDEFEYRMKGIHFSKQKVAELIPNKKVVWHVTESNLSSFADKSEWSGTKILFEIREITDNKAELRFTHVGLVPAFQCYGDCSWAWSELIQESLFSLIVTGKGRKVFD